MGFPFRFLQYNWLNTQYSRYCDVCCKYYNVILFVSTARLVWKSFTFSTLESLTICDIYIYIYLLRISSAQACIAKL